MSVHSDYMRHAIRLAERGLGRCWPNPSVGCVIVKDGVVVGVGATGEGGRPHAEAQALAMAGEAAKGATLYVTLEPCAHHGQTGPCVDAIIKAGIHEVVCALPDPDSRTNGQSIRALREAGVLVVEDISRSEAESLNEGFISRITKQRPMVSLKFAGTLDGRMATASGQSQWISGEPARNHGHLLRRQHDATLTGIGTVLADDPKLTCRLPGLEDGPYLRIVLDSRLHIPADGMMVQMVKQHPLWVITANAMAHTDYAKQLAEKGIVVLPCDTEETGLLSLPCVMKILAERGLTRVLAETGPTLGTSLLQAQLVDWLYWFSAPSLMGDRGRAAIGALAVQTLDDLIHAEPYQRLSLGRDHLDIYRLKQA